MTTPQQVLEKARDARLVAMRKLAEEWAQDARNKAREALREAIRTLIEQSLAEGVQQEPVAAPPGYTLVAVRGLQALDTALDRADRKGYMPDAIADEWARFDWCPPVVTPPQPAVPPRDKCEFCLGAKGGVPGNENRIGGHVVCDGCTPLLTQTIKAATSPAVPELPQAAEARMLTEDEQCELWAIPEGQDKLLAAAIRKFCEVNNITLGEREHGIGGTGGEQK